MSDSSVDLVLTDIPYDEVNDVFQNGKTPIRNLHKEDADKLTFQLEEFLEEILRVCAGSFYVFCGIGQISSIRNFFFENGLTPRLGIWHKTNPSPMRGQYLWLSGIEACVYAKKPAATFNEHCQVPVWRYPVGSSKRHPTEKPLALFERLVLASSNEGDLVLDPCVGSGTTAVAAMKHGRKWLGIDRNPEYVAMARERIASYSRELYFPWETGYMKEKPAEVETEMDFDVLFGGE